MSLLPFLLLFQSLLGEYLRVNNRLVIIASIMCNLEPTRTRELTTRALCNPMWITIISTWVRMPLRSQLISTWEDFISTRGELVPTWVGMPLRREIKSTWGLDLYNLHRQHSNSQSFHISYHIKYNGP